MKTADIVKGKVQKGGLVDPLIRHFLALIAVDEAGKVPCPVDGKTGKCHGVGIVVDVRVGLIRTSDICTHNTQV